MTFIGRLLIVVGTFMLLFAVPVRAQERFAGASAVISWQPEGHVPTGLGPSDIRGTLGGAGVGVGVFGGRFLTPRVGIGLEFSVASPFDGVQNAARGGESREWEVSFQDLILSPTVRFRLVDGLEVVGGGSWVLEHTTSRSAIRDAVSGMLRSVGSPDNTFRNTIGVVAGVDYAIALSARVRLAPQLRLHGVHRSGPGSGGGTKNLSPFVWRPAIALIVTSRAPRP
jgi:hypothetical protein